MKKFLSIPLVFILSYCVLFQSACTTSQINTAEQLAVVLIQDIPEFIILFGTPSAGTISSMQDAVAKATAAANLLKQAIADYQTAGPATTSQKVHFYVNEIVTDLQPILTIVGNTNPRLVAAITLSIQTANQIASVFPTSINPTAIKTSNKVKLPSPNNVQKQFDNIFNIKTVK